MPITHALRLPRSSAGFSSILLYQGVTTPFLSFILQAAGPLLLLEAPCSAEMPVEAGLLPQKGSQDAARRNREGRPGRQQ